MGCLSLAGLGKAVSEKLLEQVEARVRHWVETAARDALKLLRQHRHAHEAIVQALLQRETLYGHEVSELVSRALAAPDKALALQGPQDDSQFHQLPQPLEPQHD